MAEKIIAPTVSLVNGNPATTSLAIAECFGKRHDSAIRDIRNLIAECPEDFNIHNFVDVEYTDAKGEKRPMYTVFFDGFILLVMGYTGKKALQMKLAYIAAFNAMKEQLEAGEKPQLTAGPDAPIGPADQNTLQAIVRAKVAQMPEASNRGGFPQIWSRFNNHFRLGSYTQLPQSKMAEAVAYLVEMDVKPDKAPHQKELPQGQDKFTAFIWEVEAAHVRVAAEMHGLVDKGLKLVDCRKFGPGCMTPYTYALADWLREALTRPSPIIGGWENTDRVLNYSPMGIFREMEKDYDYLKGK